MHIKLNDLADLLSLQMFVLLDKNRKEVLPPDQGGGGGVGWWVGGVRVKKLLKCATVCHRCLTHLNDLSVLCADEEDHPGPPPQRQHCSHAVLPEDDRLWPHRLQQLDTDTSVITLESCKASSPNPQKLLDQIIFVCVKSRKYCGGRGQDLYSGNSFYYDIEISP